jgi:DNA-directed RNA polymerase specialized sigma24 family protein
MDERVVVAAPQQPVVSRSPAIDQYVVDKRDWLVGLFQHRGHGPESESLAHDVITSILLTSERLEVVPARERDFYVARMAVNLSNNVRRQNVRWKFVPLDERLAIDMGDGPVSSLAVNRALNRLSPANRETVVLRHIAGFSVDDISRELGVTPSAVRMRLFRAMQFLRQELAAAKQ